MHLRLKPGLQWVAALLALAAVAQPGRAREVRSLRLGQHHSIHLSTMHACMAKAAATVAAQLRL